MKQQVYKWPETLMESHFSLDNIDAIFYCGSVFLNNDADIKPQTMAHEHAWYEFHCVKKGCLEVKTDEKTYYIKANESLFIPPRSYHITTVGDDTQYISLGFELACNKKNTSEQLFQSMTAVFATGSCIKLTKSRKLTEICLELLCYANEGGSPNRCRFHNILTTFLFQLYDRLQITNITEQLPQQFPSETSPDLRNYLLDYLTSNKIDNITLKELSEKIYLNKKQINRIVKKRYNMTFKQKQIRFRIENAKKQLLETNLSVDQIAYLVGYTNLTSFYKAFRKIVGITPKAFRDQETASTLQKAAKENKKTKH